MAALKLQDWKVGDLDERHLGGRKGSSIMLEAQYRVFGDMCGVACSHAHAPSWEGLPSCTHVIDGCVWCSPGV
jgi:hypothetical protein